MTAFNWMCQGTEAMAYGIPLAKYRAEIGKDPDGAEWLVECAPILEKALNGEALYRIKFDKAISCFNDDDCEDTPFVREVVLNAGNYWSACRKYYHMQEVQYKKINETIEKFRISKGITW